MAAADLSTLNMSVPDVKGAVFAGHMPGSTLLTVSVALQPSNRAALFAYADAVNDPKGIFYRKFLTPASLGARFGASAATVGAMTSYLASKGLKVTLTCPNRMLLVAQGKASAVESAFNTKIDLYSAPSRVVGRKSFYSYTSAPKLTKSLAANVVAIGGLQTAYLPLPANTATPAQFRTLYGAAPLYDDKGRHGEGVAIGVTNYDGYSLADAKTFINSFKLPTPTGGAGANITKVSIGGSDGETVAAEGEGDLDIDCVLGMAPRANIYIYDASQTGDSLALLGQMISENRVDIVTESYGTNPVDGNASYLVAESDLHASLATLGITYMAASGDEGATNFIRASDGTLVNGFGYPAMDPNVLAVGGSWTNVNSDGTRGTELGWDGSGGGWKTYNIAFNHKPVYQRQSIVNLPVPAGDYRFYPDVCLSAAGSNLRDGRDPRGDNGVPFILSYYTVSGGVLGPNGGGTSAASPTMAGGLALVLQELRAQNAIDPDASGKYRLSRVQDFLYETVGQDPSVFYDVQGGDIGVLPDGSEGVGAVGWDFVTGLGAVDFNGLTNSYIAAASIDAVAYASTTNLYSVTLPPAVNLTLGKVMSGDATSLAQTDGLSYIVQSVSQPGVGQVAAATVTVPLQTSKVRRSASVTLSMQVPVKATGYLYLKNANTGAYDLVNTITGTGTMGTITIPLDITANTYISGSTNGTAGTVTALVRSLQPARFGSVPFKMTVDQVTVTERVPRG